MVKLICTDIDGTLLNKQREVDDYTVKVFHQLDKNIQVVLASSRMPKAIYHIQEKMNAAQTPLICYNGALQLASGSTFEKEKIISSVTISSKMVQEIMELAKAQKVHISLFQNNFWRVSALDFYAQREINNTRVQPDGLLSDFNPQELHDFIQKGAHKIMLMGEPNLIDLIEEKLRANTAVAMWRSKDIYLEITPPTNKSEGLATLLNQFPAYKAITFNEIMAFGDGFNDVEMLTKAHYGVAVANAVPALKKIAYAVTQSNIENGVAQYVNAFFKLDVKDISVS